MSLNAIQQSRKKSYRSKISIFCSGGVLKVYVTFEGAVSTRVKTDFAYRADDNPAQILRATRTSSDRKSVILSDDDAHGREFVRQVSPSSRLFVRIDSPGTGISEANFYTAGAPEALRRALGDCPAPEQEPRRTRA